MVKPAVPRPIRFAENKGQRANHGWRTAQNDFLPPNGLDPPCARFGCYAQLKVMNQKPWVGSGLG